MFASKIGVWVEKWFFLPCSGKKKRCLGRKLLICVPKMMFGSKNWCICRKGEAWVEKRCFERKMLSGSKNGVSAGKCCLGGKHGVRVQKMMSGSKFGASQEK